MKRISGICEISTGVWSPTSIMPTYTGENDATELTAKFTMDGAPYAIPAGAQVTCYLLYLSLGAMTESLNMRLDGDTASVEIPASYMSVAGTPYMVIRLYNQGQTVVASRFPFEITEAIAGSKLVMRPATPDIFAGLLILGTYASIEALKSAVPNPRVGDLYNAGVTPPYQIYRWSNIPSIGIDGWEPQGQWQGPAAGFDTPEATAHSVGISGAPTAAVTASGPDTNKKFSFDFGLQKGDTGAPAGFGAPIIGIETLNYVQKATAEISASGPDTAKVFDIALGVPRGVRGSMAFHGQAITGTSATPAAYPTGIAEAFIGDRYYYNGVDAENIGNVYRCVDAGAASDALWVFDSNIRGGAGSGSVSFVNNISPDANGNISIEAADIPTAAPGVSVEAALAGKAALIHAARHLPGGGDPLTVNLANMVAGVLGIPNGGHGKPTRYEGMHNLFSAGAEWANDVNRATTTGLTITSQGWANLPNPDEPFGILVSFTSYPGPTSYGFCLQIWVGILSEEMYYRTAIDDERGFMAWKKTSTVTPTIASGTVYISLAANTVGGVSVTVPSGVEHVVASPITTTPQNVRVSSGTVEGTSVWIGAHSTTAQTLAVNWIAVG